MKRIILYVLIGLKSNGYSSAMVETMITNMNSELYNSQEILEVYNGIDYDTLNIRLLKAK